MVTFDADRKKVIHEKSEEREPRNDVDELLNGMKGVLSKSGRRHFALEEKKRIMDVVRVLVS